MSDVQNVKVPGMMYPTQIGMSSGTARDSAIANQKMVDTNQALAGKLLTGGKFKRRYKHRGGSDSKGVVVPQFQMLYPPQGGPGTNPNNQIQANSATSTQGTANAVYDKYASVGGYRVKSKRGGNPDWNWGCYSGGKKTKKSRHSRRSKKSTKRSRTNKSRKHKKH
jgi:hypothetical protein